MAGDGIPFAETSNPLLADDPVEEKITPDEQPEEQSQEASPTTETPPVTPETKPKDEPSTTDDVAYAEWLKKQPLEKIFQLHPGLTGKLGELSQKQVESAKKQWEKEQSEKARLDLARTDPFEFAKREIDESERQRMQGSIQFAAEARARETVQEMMNGLAMVLPAEVVNVHAGKSYPGDFSQATIAYLKDVFNTAVEQAIAAERAKWERDARPALQKVAMTQAHATTPNPDLGSGVPAPGTRVLTAADVDRMSLPEYDKYFDENGDPREGVQYLGNRKA